MADSNARLKNGARPVGGFGTASHGTMTWQRGLSVGAALVWLLMGLPASAVVQILPEATLTTGGRTITDAATIRADPLVKDVLSAFERAERALRARDLVAMMEFYAPSYNYHGLRLPAVERIWSEVFEHYHDLSSTHLFSEMKLIRDGAELRIEVTCTGGLYGSEVATNKRITLDSWFREVHFLVRDKRGWRFLGNKGDAPTATPFSSSPHHPLF